jgi:hypothetical protein
MKPGHVERREFERAVPAFGSITCGVGRLLRWRRLGGRRGLPVSAVIHVTARDRSAVRGSGQRRWPTGEAGALPLPLAKAAPVT